MEIRSVGVREIWSYSIEAIKTFRIWIEDSTMFDATELKREIDGLSERLGKTQEYL